jgi:lambda repressor-like predicted transcriptional regulator
MVAKSTSGVRAPTYEELSDPYVAYLYAERVLRGPFPEGEWIIARLAHSSLLYAKNVLKGQFEAGEPEIAKGSYDSFDYAANVLHGPFPLGEGTLAQSLWGARYAELVLKRPWPAVEKCLFESANGVVILDYLAMVSKSGIDAKEYLVQQVALGIIPLEYCHGYLS